MCIIIPMTQTADLKSRPDAEIVKLVLTDSSLFAVLVERYEQKLKRYIMRIGVVDSQTAEDLLQEVFIKIYQNLNDFDPEFSFSSWIYRITHNVVVSHLRRMNVSPKVVSIDDENDSKNFIDKLPGDVDLPREIDRKHVSKKVLQALAELAEDYREVLVLFYIEEKSYKEISDILKRPINTVSSMINRAKMKLKSKLQAIN